VKIGKELKTAYLILIPPALFFLRATGEQCRPERFL
jgi:hypothetical protein